MGLTADALLDPRLEAALEPLGADLGPLEVSERLRERLPVDLARAGAELHELRRRAERKLSGARQLLLTRKGLEQATDRRVAAVRARRIARLSEGRKVLDATAGIGGDALVLTGLGEVDLVAADSDPGLARLLRANLRRVGGTDPAPPVLAARAEDRAVRTPFLCLDPDRRPGAGGDRRVLRPERWSPAWSSCARLLLGYEGACLKLPPALDVDRLELPAGLAHRWQWTSLGGELKEVVLWTGSWADDSIPGRREVTLVGLDGRETCWDAARKRVPPLSLDAARAVAWIAEPDPAVIRAGLLGALAHASGLAPLAAEIAYLGGLEPPRYPWLSTYRVLAACPLDRKRVRRMLGDHGVGPVTVKKRGIDEDASSLARRLKGPGASRGVLVLVRLERGRHAYLVRQDPER